MSKIEKALRKAQRESQSLSLAPAQLLRPNGAGGTPDVPHDGGKAISFGSSATIPLMQQPEVMRPEERALSKVILSDVDESPALKAFRAIRTRIVQRVGTGGSVILVTALQPGGGATFTAVNLGAAIGLDANKTSLLVDCNFRYPSLQRFVSTNSGKGLSDYLSGKCNDVGAIICPTGIERLRIVPAGNQIDPGKEYFTGERMHQLIWNVRERYPDRSVILDCAPLRTADTQILLQLCDHVLIVVPYGRVTESQLRASLKLVDPNKLLGVVINDEPHVPRLDWRVLIKSMISGLFRGKR